jgi:hypothetical protein
MQNELFKKFIKEHNKFSLSQHLSQNPIDFFKFNNFEEYSFLLNDNYEKTRVNIYRHVYGESKCSICNKINDRLFPGWNRGWAKTCSDECENKLHSDRQLGDKNTSHRMSETSKNNMKIKMSNIMKDKILNNEFTPKSENYKTFGMIHFNHNNKVEKVRSLWELIYWLKNPDLQYEKVRIKYFDTIQNKERIYITDFYDIKSNTVIEIKPKKYQYTLIDKIKAIEKSDYNFKIIDDDYFNNIKSEDLIKQIKNVVINFDKIENRIKWLKK